MVKLSIKESLGVAVLRGTLLTADYKQVAEWLDCYEYIPPVSRVLLIPLTPHNTKPFTPSEHFKIWLISDCLYCGFTATEQERIISWMKDYNY